MKSMTIQLRHGQEPQENYQTWDSTMRMTTCVICGNKAFHFALIYKGYCFCQNDLPTGFDRWDGEQIEGQPFKAANATED